MPEDHIYALPLDQVGDFRFDESVVAVFSDMIRRSVPGYASVLAMTAELAERYATDSSNIYDLGCSLGAATLAMRARVPASCRIHAVDASSAMIETLRTRLDPVASQQAKIEIHEAELQNVPIHSASFAVLNFTLQFIPPAERAGCLRQILHGLQPGGALVLSEKICFEDPAQQALMTELHHAFKSANGYSELEISQKRTALENTLITETVETHVTRLRDVGYSQVAVWFQCFNFVSILAVK